MTARFKVTHDDGSVLLADWATYINNGDNVAVNLYSGGYVEVPGTWDIEDRGAPFHHGAVIREKSSGNLAFRSDPQFERPWRYGTSTLTDHAMQSRLDSGEFELVFEGVPEVTG